jgi:hypothetical protein
MAVTALMAILGMSAMHAATTSASPDAPAIGSYDIANYSASTGTDKWWHESSTAGRPKGQTFTTGPGAFQLNSITYQIATSQKAEPTKTYVIRVGIVAGSTFTEIHSETATQSLTWKANEFMTWTFDMPPLLQSNTTYGVDVGITSSTSAWQTGIPYIKITDNDFSGGARYMSGTSGFGVGDSSLNNTSGDRVFHIDLEPPLGAMLDFVAGTPADDTADALAFDSLIATCSQNLAPGTGDVTIRNLTDSIDTVIPVGDARISMSENLLVITPAIPLLWSKDYAIQIAPGAIESDTGNSFAGINDDTTWNFTTAVGDPLLLAVAGLKDHINGTVTLDASQIAAHKETIDLNRNRFDSNATIITSLFDLITTYDSVIGPLWIARGQFTRSSQTDDLDWTIYHVMQYIMDEVYNAETIANHEALLDGYKFGSSANFPGSVDPPLDPNDSHTAPINGSFPDTFGRETQQWTLPARKPTGCYLAPGTIATVFVPESLVDQGYKVRIGAHSVDMSNRPWVRRLDRATILYNLDATTIKVASPYGGGIYIEVPQNANAGVVNVTVTGAVRSPYFSAKSFHTTTLGDWRNTERHHTAPWADFQTDKFMMLVPTNWIYALNDPVTLMANWDAAMDAMNDLMGFPRIRGKETMYPQVDLLLRNSVYAPGYPSINVSDNPNNNRNGNHSHHLVRGPQFATDYEFHEQGHGYFFPKFGGETEANVNLPHVAVWHQKFGYSLDQAFAASRGFGNNPHRTLDNTAVTWMTVFNFSPREVPMADGEKAYQLKGHAKFVDIALLFGWEKLNDFWLSFSQNEADGVSYSTSTDAMLLRLSKSVGKDIRPLLHFWGIHPGNPGNLAADIAAEGLMPSTEIYQRLLHYKSLVPADNAVFRAFALNWWGKQPSINGNWTEREHSRQWDTEELFGAGDQQRPNGEIYTSDSAADIEARVDELIELYFPFAADYGTWAALYSGIDLSDSDADLTGNGLTNNEARIWGLHPASGSTTNPLAIPQNASAGTFTYTRRDPVLTGHSFSVWTSTDLQTWVEDTGATQTPVFNTPTADVETVTVSLTASLLAEPRLYVQVQAD